MSTARRTTLATLGAAALLATTASAAHAGPPWTVSVGGSSTGAPVPFTAPSLGPLEFTVPGLVLGCESSSVEGVINPGPTSSTAGVITSSTFTGCVGPLGTDFQVTQNAPWSIDIVGDQAGGITPGEIRSIDASVSNPDGLCSFDITGVKDGFLDQNTQTVGADNTQGAERLLVSNVDGCFGLILEGDPATVVSSWALTDIAPVTITN